MIYKSTQIPSNPSSEGNPLNSHPSNPSNSIQMPIEIQIMCVVDFFFPWVGCPSSLDIILEGTAPGQHEKPQPKPKWPSPWFVFNPRTSRGDVSTFSHLKGENCATVVLNVSRESREILRLPDLENENTYSGSIKHVQTTQNTIQHHWTSSPKPFSSSSSSSHRQTGN
jgi:hypothetical protein